MASMISMLGKAGKEIISEGGKKAVSTIGRAHENATLGAARKLKNLTKNSNGIIGKAVNESASETTSKIAQGRLAKETWFGKAADDIAFADVSKETLKTYAGDLNLSKGGSKSKIIDRINDSTSNIVQEAIVTDSKGTAEAASNAISNVSDIPKGKGSGIGKNALIGGAVGSISGAGIGGITGMATGADEDDMKSMVLMGALAGGAGGAMIGAGSKMIRNKQVAGSMFSQTTDDALKAAEQMATKGGENAAVNGGAKGFFNKVGVKVQSFGDKIDNIGDNVSNKVMANKTAQMDAPVRDKIFKEFQDVGFDMADAQDYAQGLYGDMKLADAVKPFQNRANMLGGAAQGAIMGSASGAIIGGVGGAIDEDESFIGGALKGGLIGGTLGGIGGGVSGHFNNSARLLSNTTANVNSLLGR